VTCSLPPIDLEGRTIIVTGASSGLGESFARSLSAAGADLVLAARRAERIERLAAELGALAVACDVTDAADREQLLAAALERSGRIDGLVNNAGINHVAPALKLPVDDFRRVLEVDLVAPFALAQAAAVAMRAGDGGSIVNVSSVQALRSFRHIPDAAYVAAKAGLSALTRELAMQWARYGIRVNALAPGGFVTEMTGSAFIEGPILETMEASVPLGRPGADGELAGALLLLLADAGSYITGQTVVVDGGWTL
jgi:NAD(P)-dependent dehydrogenase (short-subunit alcohol dehydrogenase family)